MQSPDLRTYLAQNPYRRKGREITYLPLEKVNFAFSHLYTASLFLMSMIFLMKVRY